MAERGYKKRQASNVVRLQAAQRQDSSYYHDAFEDYRPGLQRFIAKRLGNPEDVADVLQDVYVRLLRYEHPEKIKNLQAFLYTTASNLVRDRFRRSQTRMTDSHVPSDSVDLVAETTEPYRQLTSAEIRTLLRDALLELDDHCRHAFIKHRFDMRTHAEIAKEMGTTVGIVRKYISIALVHCTEKLRDHL